MHVTFCIISENYLIMRIATEIGWGHKAGGARRVAIKTLLEMTLLRSEHEYFVYSSSNHTELDRMSITQIQLSAPNFVPQVVWDQIIFPHFSVPAEIHRSIPDVIHHTNNMVSYWRLTPTVVTIHDMTPFVIPESFGRLHGAYQRAYFRFAAKKSSKIITVSEHSKRDICRILSVDEKKIVVVPLAADLGNSSALAASSSIDIKSRFGISNSFILYVGAIHPRKNVGRILDAFVSLKRDKGIPHQLVIAGDFRWMVRKSLQTSGFNLVKQHTVFTGRVSDVELISLYSKCDAFVWPSLYEGFGLPVLEAMSFGAPVVTSNCSSLPEVAGDAAILVDPYNVEDISRGMWAVLDNPGLADDLRNKGIKQAAQFSWRKTARKVLEVLESFA